MEFWIVSFMLITDVLLESFLTGYALQVGADIVKRSLSYPLKLIAKNAGVNGSVVSEKVQHLIAVFIIREIRDNIFDEQ